MNAERFPPPQEAASSRWDATTPETVVSGQAPKLGGIVAAWLMLSVAGFFYLTGYANRPGSKGAVPATWPEILDHARFEDRHTLMVFAHPMCPCTRATLEELAWIMTRVRSRVDCHVYFLQPAGSSNGWVGGDAWEAAAAINGVIVKADPGGRVASCFGARTSGHALLYDSAGRLRFDGGITASRGHQGTNRGRDLIVTIATSERNLDRHAIQADPGQPGGRPVANTCVFGCDLFAPDPQVSADQTPTRAER